MEDCRYHWVDLALGKLLKEWRGKLTIKIKNARELPTAAEIESAIKSLKPDHVEPGHWQEFVDYRGSEEFGVR